MNIVSRDVAYAIGKPDTQMRFYARTHGRLVTVKKKWRNPASERRGRRDDRGLSPHNYTPTITFVSSSDGDVINNNCTCQVWTDNFD